ncbi:MAG: NUDIX domain-containing protein [Chloroflexia bacterium]|nr:NUDIX domain-containing protein [Chloroflexia bacterium]
MHAMLGGLREAALTLTYNLFLVARTASRVITRPTQIGVRVLVPQDDRVLLVRHRGGRWPWALPGGGAEPGESLEHSALRELREEAGCHGEVAHLHGLFHNFSEGMNNLIAVFVCHTNEAAHPPAGDLEIVAAHFFLYRDLPANLDPGSRERIAEYRRGERGMYRDW